MAPVCWDGNQKNSSEEDSSDSLDPRIEERMREIDASLSRGNILLQCGLVAYEDEVADLRSRFLKMNFH
jgi:hypothetical protein